MKIVRAVASVVAVAAQVASIIALATGNPGLAATLQTVAVVASAVALVSSFFVKPPGLGGGGTTTDWKADPQAGVPIVIGRTANGGNIVHHDSFGKDNKFAFFSTVLSYGPIEEYEALLVDRQAVTFDGSNNAVGYYSDRMWLDTQLGATPEASALTPTNIGPWPGWDAASKLSGFAADLWELKYDVKGDVNYINGIPKRLSILKGVKVYDPRLDSTYPGGSGSCRALNESTYVYSENPWLHALTWAFGRFQNGVKVVGVGMALAAINVPAYVEAANIADANGWSCGGVVYSTDDKWDRLKAMAQAGGGVPTRQSAQLSCLVNAPRVSLATITRADLAGDATIAGTTSRRQRINGVVPRYRSEDHDWEIVPAAVVRVADYVTADGGERTRELDMPLVQDVDQAAQLARYEIENNRERGPITLPLKPLWIGYKPGDCVTVDIAEIGLIEQPCIIRNRTIDPATGTVTFELMTETAAKHDALVETGTAPPPVDTTPPDLGTIDAPAAGTWSVVATSITSGGVAQPALVITGASDNDTADGIVFEYRISGAGTWNPAGVELTSITRKEILGVNPDTSYDVAISYRFRGVQGARLIITAGGTTPASPYVIVGSGAAVAASDVTFSPTGDVAAANVQAAIAELDTEKAPKASPAFTGGASAPGTSGTVAAFSARRGGGSGTTNANERQIEFGYNGSNDYRHAIVTQHNAGVNAGNILEIWLHQGASQAAGDVPNSKVAAFSISSGLALPTHGTTASASNTYIDAGTGVLSRSTSSGRYKHDLRPISVAEARRVVRALKGVMYRSLASLDDPDRLYPGLIAEEVAPVAPWLVEWAYREEDYDKRFADPKARVKAGAKLKPEAVMYDRVSILLAIVAQDDERRIDALEAAQLT